MMKRLGILMIAGLMATPAIAEEIDAETVGKIEAYLASIECQWTLMTSRLKTMVMIWMTSSARVATSSILSWTRL